MSKLPAGVATHGQGHQKGAVARAKQPAATVPTYNGSRLRARVVACGSGAAAKGDDGPLYLKEPSLALAEFLQARYKDIEVGFLHYKPLLVAPFRVGVLNCASSTRGEYPTSCSSCSLSHSS
ncbi:hypothetical protein GW17_00046549 [Ensete ventricosum]|nr:hypothetical protein GW17_00046549 [Ensete ventricosum]